MFWHYMNNVPDRTGREARPDRKPDQTGSWTGQEAGPDWKPDRTRIRSRTTLEAGPDQKPEARPDQKPNQSGSLTEAEAGSRIGLEAGSWN